MTCRVCAEGRALVATGPLALAIALALALLTGPVGAADPWPAHEARVERWLRVGHRDRALAVAAELARAHPGEARAHALLGFVAGLAGRAADAERALARAVELDGRAPYARGRHAQALRTLGRYEEALAEAREADRLAGGTPDTLRLLAETAMAAGRPRAALDACARAWERDRAHAAAWAFDAAQAALLAGEPGRALEWEARARPSRSPYRSAVLRGRIHEALRAPARALEHYEEALRLGRPGDPLYRDVEVRVQVLRFPVR
jgi:tetratricopeptide (TPR) repeat protein